MNDSERNTAREKKLKRKLIDHYGFDNDGLLNAVMRNLERRDYFGVEDAGDKQLQDDGSKAYPDTYTDDEIINEALEVQGDFNDLSQSGPRSKPVSSKKKNSREMAPPTLNSALTLRQEVLSDIYADMARDKDVIRFRQECFGGKKLKWERVEAWINEQVEKEEREGLPDLWLTVPVTKDEATAVFGNRRKKISQSQCGRLGTELNTLSYAIPGSGWSHKKPVKIGGVLDRLRKLSETLADTYSWQKEQATVFVLTGVTPLVSPAGVTVTGSHTPSAMRIELSLDARLTLDQVREIYEQAQRRLLNKKPRSMSEKHLTLALFYSRKKTKDKSAEKQMESWNDLHPEWRYKEHRILRRDGRDAVKRLLNPDYQP